MPLIYSIPLPALFVLVLSLCFILGILGTWLVRSLDWMVDRDDNDAVVLTHAFAGVLYAVALGLMVVNVQSGYTEVKLVSVQEANLIEDLYIDSEGLSSPDRKILQDLTLGYIGEIINEWPNIGTTPDSDLPSHQLVEELTFAILNHEPQTEKDLIIYSEIFAGLNEMLDMRRERLHLGRDGVGPVTWFVVAIGALVSIGMTCFYHTNSPRTHYSLVGMMSVMFGLMMFLIIAMDHPLLGRFSVDSVPFQEAQADMHVWARRFSDT